MRRYKDGLGYVYEVPDECVPEFERRRGNLLKIEIVLKLILIAGLLWLAWR